MRESVIASLNPPSKSETAGPSKTREYSQSGRNEKVRRAVENHGKGLECGNVAYRIFHLNKVSF